MEYDEELPDYGNDSDDGTREEEKGKAIVLIENVAPGTRDASSAASQNITLCSACGDEMAVGMLACTSCGHPTGPIAQNARKRAKEIKERTQLEIVWVSRGPRSQEASVRRKYRRYVKSAIKKGFKTVAERFDCDEQFRSEMENQGWISETIDTIDQGAAEPGQEGEHRSGSKIRDSARYVYRGKKFAADDETWDKAYYYSVDEETEFRHWKKAKKGRGKGTSQTSYPSTYWREEGQ